MGRRERPVRRLRVAGPAVRPPPSAPRDRRRRPQPAQCRCHRRTRRARVAAAPRRTGAAMTAAQERYDLDRAIVTDEQNLVTDANRARLQSAGEGGIFDDDWPNLDHDALVGLTGQLVRTLEPHTEADPAGLLV